jgi:DNA-directed RNA polymerase specialized sigma24 family protein
MSGDIENNPPVWVRQSDEPGKSIEPDLLDAAQRTWKRVFAYAQRHQQDPARTADIFESILVSLSNARKTNGNLGTPIRNLDNYLFVAFVHRMNRQQAREPRIEAVGSLQDLEAYSGIRGSAVSPSIDDVLLIEELMGYMDERTRRMLTLRIMGYSWNEIAQILKSTANNAQVLFNQGVKKARNYVMKMKDPKNTSAKGGEADE